MIESLLDNVGPMDAPAAKPVHPDAEKNKQRGKRAEEYYGLMKMEDGTSHFSQGRVLGVGEDHVWLTWRDRCGRRCAPDKVLFAQSQEAFARELKAALLKGGFES